MRSESNEVKTPSTNDLLCLAETAGVPVTWHRGGPQGAWIPQQNRISIRDGMDDAHTRSTLAHELAHMVFRHPPKATQRQERQADKFAAKLLITEAGYASAEAIYGPSPQQIAAELNVTTHLLAVWRNTYERTVS